MPDIRLTQHASDRLAQILNWTAERFGPDQATSYAAALSDRLAKLQDGTAHTKPAYQMTGRRADAGVLLLRAGAHYALIVPHKGDFVVIDFLHGTSDLAQQIDQIPENR